MSKTKKVDLTFKERLLQTIQLVEQPTSIEFLDVLKTLSEYTEVIGGLFNNADQGHVPKVTLEYYGKMPDGFCYNILIQNSLNTSKKILSVAIPADCNPIIIYTSFEGELGEIICHNQAEFEKALIESVNQPHIKDMLMFLRSFFQ